LTTRESAIAADRLIASGNAEEVKNKARVELDVAIADFLSEGFKREKKMHVKISTAAVLGEGDAQALRSRSGVRRSDAQNSSWMEQPPIFTKRRPQV
jgi:hypothetical protein